MTGRDAAWGVALLALAGSALAGEEVSFSAQIAPLLKARCAVCHLTGQEAGNMALHPGAAYESLVGVKSIESPWLRVDPGAPQKSYLVAKLRGTQLEAGGSGTRMPFDQPPLDDATMRLITDWIAQGARRN